MGRLKFGLVMLLVLTAGCSQVRESTTSSSEAPPPPPPPAIQTCPDGSVISETATCPAGPAAAVEFVPVTSVITRETNMVAVGGGYATIILTPGHAHRSQIACASATEQMEAKAGAPAIKPTMIDGSLVFERPVYWPVKVASAAKCAPMVANYDYERAGLLLHRLPGWDKFGIGPFVVVWRADGKEAGVFDFSMVPTSDFGREFGAVAKYMSRRSDVWSASFYQSASYKEILKSYLLDSPASLFFAKLLKLA